MATDQVEDLQKQIPEEYRGEVLEVLFEALGPRIQEAADAIDGVTDYFNPDLMPDSALEWALRRVGWPVESFWGAYVQRQVLKKLLIWRLYYARTGVLEDIVTTYFKTTQTTNPLQVQFVVRKSTAGGFRIGAGRIGPGRVWNKFNRYNIRVRVTALGDYAWNAQTKDRLRALIEEILPARMLYQIEEAYA